MNFIPLFVGLSKWLIALVIGGALSACAVTQEASKVEHGFDISNAGPTDVSDVLIRYGEVRRTFCDRGLPCRKGYSTFYGIHTPIQEEMRVSWKTADGAQHDVRVPVKERVKDLNRFRRLFLKFHAGELVVTQGSFFRNPGLVGWDESPLYP